MSTPLEVHIRLTIASHNRSSTHNDAIGHKPIAIQCNYHTNQLIKKGEINTLTHTRTHIHTHAYTNAHAHAHTHTRTRTHAHTHIHT